MVHQEFKLLGRNGDNELLISFLVSSEKREKLLLLLRNSPKTLQQIRDSLNVTSAGIIPEIRKMEEKNLIYKNNREYNLTEIGEIVSESLGKFEQTLNVLGRNSKFWNEHNISAIPIEFRMKLYELGDYEIIKSAPNEIFNPQKEYKKELLNAKYLKALSSVFHPDYPEYVIGLADRGVPVSLIITKELLEDIKEKYGEELKRGLSYENTNIMICDDFIKISFSVTDLFLSIKLFLKDNNYDFYQNILCYNRSALIWGDELFNYYARLSKRVTLKDI